MEEKKNNIIDKIVFKKDKAKNRIVLDSPETGKDNISLRMKCIDILRGMTIASMLIMENPGNPYHVSKQLVHALWDGLTFADIAFPFFIFIAGVSLPFALKKRLDKAESKLKIYIHILYRATAIFLTGLFLNGFPNFNFSTIRIPGPLQRIAVVYLVAAVLVIEANTIIQAALAVFIGLGYLLLLKYVNVPGYGPGILSQDGNLVQYVDLFILKGHLYTPTWDPEGIISTIPAISTILFGVIGGQFLLWNKKSRAVKLICLLASGGAILVAGLILSKYMPINKNLWSSSFTFYTAGLALLALGFIYLITDIIGYDSIFKPFIILGSSPMLVYFGLEIVRKTIWLIQIPDKATGQSLYLNNWLCNHIVTPWAGNVNDTYYFSILYTLLWVLIVRAYKGRKNEVKA